MNSATLYFHYPCFDGLVSAVLAWEFLERHESWRIVNFCPVDYKLRESWLSNKLNKPCAIVDFLYHPDADFWADHHQTTMLTEEAKADFLRRKQNGSLFYDGRARSCSSLLFRRFRSALSHKPHFVEMVSWAEKIDAAAYSSVGEAILGNSAALKISRSLAADDADQHYAHSLLRELRAHDLRYVANLDEVKRRERTVRREIMKGLRSVETSLRVEPGEIAVVDTEPHPTQIISRYAPYYFRPRARYSISVLRSPESIRITAMRNPWRSFRSISLGRAFAKFGGGGHQRVGAVQFRADQAKRAEDLIGSLLSQMRRPSR